jgi:hypothetical protein
MRARLFERRAVATARAQPARAVHQRWNIELVGLRVRRERVVGVVDALPPDQLEADRDVLTAAEAEAFVELGCADPAQTATVIRFPEHW